MNTGIESLRIVKYATKYQDQVVDVVGRELRSWKVLPQSVNPILDDDLYNIAKIYRGRSRFWVALIRDRVVGTVGIRESATKIAKLSRMFVLDKYHGTGIGQKLLEKALKFAKKNGYEEVVLNSHYLLTRSHNFYKKNGFVLQGRNKDRLHFRLSCS